MIDRSWPPGSADVPVGSHFELVTHGDLVLPGVTQPAQTSCKMGIPLAMWLRTFGAGVPARGAGSLMPLEGIRRGQRSAVGGVWRWASGH